MSDEYMQDWNLVVSKAEQAAEEWFSRTYGKEKVMDDLAYHVIKVLNASGRGWSTDDILCHVGGAHNELHALQVAEDAAKKSKVEHRVYKLLEVVRPQREGTKCHEE